MGPQLHLGESGSHTIQLKDSIGAAGKQGIAGTMQDQQTNTNTATSIFLVVSI